MQRSAEAVRVTEGLIDASCFMEVGRLREWFCGFRRRSDSAGATLYPVARSPQPWASRSVFMLLQALLGIEADLVKRRIHLSYSCLSAMVHDLRIENPPVGGSVADIVSPRFMVEQFPPCCGASRWNLFPDALRTDEGKA